MGVANERSIAWGISQKLASAGALSVEDERRQLRTRLDECTTENEDLSRKVADLELILSKRDDTSQDDTRGLVKENAELKSLLAKSNDDVSQALEASNLLAMELREKKTELHRLEDRLSNIESSNTSPGQLVDDA